MSIQGIILDLSGTTFKPDGTIQEGVEELLEFCSVNDLKIAFTTNEDFYADKLRRSNIEYDVLVTPNEVNKPKPSPRFIEYIEELMQDEDKKRKMGESGLRHVRSNFTWEKAAKKYVQAFQSEGIDIG